MGDEAAIGRELEEILSIEIEPEAFYEWVADKRVAQALDDLDINPDDHAYLFDILDCDNSRTLFVTEIIDGIMRLRGDTRRSDVITVDLMVRQVLSQMNTLIEGVDKL